VDHLGLSGGRHRQLNKSYLNQSPAAYTPHTVFLLESRYPVSYGAGREDSVHHIFGVAPAGLLPDVLKTYNSTEAGTEALELMDNARWPWNAQQKLKMTKWWTNKTEWLERMRQLEGNQDLGHDDFGALKYNHVVDPSQEIIDDINGNQGEIKSFPPSPAQNSRKQPDDYNPTPERFLKQTAGVREAHSEHSMDLFTGGMTRFKGKIPFEVPAVDGSYEHPSGFRIPTPAHHFSENLPPVEQPPPPRDEVQNTGGHIDAESWSKLNKEKQGLMTGLMTGTIDVEIVTRQEKIPTEIHGENMEHQHASGFTPPTPLMPRGDFEAHSQRISLIQDETTTQIAGSDELDSSDDSLTQVQTIPIRAQYIPHVAETPFWRPILSFTVSTRPLALTLLRLSKGLARGTSYHSLIDNIKKKDSLSHGLRNRNLRLNRMEELIRGLSEALAGKRGEVPAIRFSVDENSVEEQIPFAKRVVGVGIGTWYHRKHELAETYALLGGELKTGAENAQNPFVTYELDEFGRIMGPKSATDGLPEDYFKPSDYSTTPPPPAFTEINRIRRVLDRVGPNARSLYVVSPKDGLKGLEKVTDTTENRLIRVIYPVISQAEAASIQGGENEVVIHGGNAVHFLKQRMQQLSENFKDEIATFRASRSAKVVYPNKSAEDEHEDH